MGSLSARPWRRRSPIEPLTVGSLFSGIGGLDLGLEWAGGFRTIWFCESDPFCRAVLAEHWPGIPIHGDIRKMDWTKVSRSDVLTGGFPCQDVSTAGKREGIKEGNRSGLWFEFRRAIAALRPRYVLIENVSGLVSGGGLDIVLAGLGSIGYRALRPVLLEAASVGAPHHRERIFILSYNNGGGHIHGQFEEQPNKRKEQALGDVRQGSKSEPLADSLRRGCEEREVGRPSEEVSTSARNRGRDAADAYVEGLQKPACRELRSVQKAAEEFARSEPYGDTSAAGSYWEIEPDVGRVAHGVPARVDRLKALGNAVVPQCAQVIGIAILELEKARRENDTE